VRLADQDPTVNLSPNGDGAPVRPSQACEGQAAARHRPHTSEPYTTSSLLSSLPRDILS
jgi:hypothetical protein